MRLSFLMICLFCRRMSNWGYVFFNLHLFSFFGVWGGGGLNTLWYFIFHSILIVDILSFFLVVSNYRYTITRCDGSYKSGKIVYVDFNPMNQPCACTLTASFNGTLLVIAELNGYYECRNEVVVSLNTDISVFHCDGIYPSAIHYNVVNNVSVVNVKATYTKNYTSGEFPLCLKINQNGKVYVFILRIYWFEYRIGTITLYNWIIS